MPFSMNLFLRSLAGLILAPVVGAAVAVLILSLADMSTTPVRALTNATVLGAVFGLTFGGMPAFLMGWPLHLLLLRSGWRSIWVYAGLGAVLGIAAIFMSTSMWSLLERN